MEARLDKAKQHQTVNVAPELSQIGATAVHEDQHHQEISAELQSVHPEANTSKDAVVPEINPVPNLVRLPEKPTGSPVKDSSWGQLVMARKLFERNKKKGELKNAA